MSLIIVTMPNNDEVMVLPGVGGERIVSAFFHSVTGKSKAVEHFDIVDNCSQFVIVGADLDLSIPLLEKDSKGIVEFFKKDYSAQSIGVSPEDGFRFILR